MSRKKDRHSVSPRAAPDALDAALRQASSGAMSVIDLFSAAQSLTGQGKPEAAIALYRRWLAHSQSEIAYAVYFNFGVSLSDSGDKAGAEQAYRQAIFLKSDFIEAHLNLATLLEQGQQFEEALASWGKVLTFVRAGVAADKQHALQALNNIGRLLEIRKRYKEAEQTLARSLEIDPRQPNVITHWVHLRQKQCAWPVYQPLPGLSTAEMIAATSALAMLSASDQPHMQLAAARRFVREKVLEGVAPLAGSKGYGHQKIRIGYLSSDFVSHAVSILTAELYELHDRRRFEVYGFCWSREDGSPLRARVIQAIDHFIRIGELGDEQAAQVIRAHEIDILVDLHGLTLGTRPNILSYRPAPVQLTYLGFPGTSALPEIDYVIADRFVLPPELAPFFTEKPLYMPHCFQINDRQRAIGPRPSRASCALPEDALVFCSFNNNFKINEEMFLCWMRILGRVPGSVLWLVSDHDSVRENLSLTAEQNGIARERLIFATRTGTMDYLARYQIADLFLDTYPFNAGTTASDALWAGLPLLTYTGATFASRMAGSLLRAVDLPELISYSLAEYEEKAVALAGDRDRLAALKRHLQENRLACRLFDSVQFVRDLENLLLPLVHASPHIKPKEKTMKLPAQTPISDSGRVLNFKVPTSWGLTDPVRFYALMDEALKLVVPGYYLGDNLMTWGRGNSLFEDLAFRKSWEDNQQNDADKAIAWRRYILACAAYHCAQLEGDFVECGVYRGTGMKTVIDYFGNSEFTKTFWGYDTFDYNPVEDHAFAGQEDGLYQEIVQRFAGYDQVRLVKGLLPASLAGNAPEKIAYMHIDLNSAEYEIAVLEVLFGRLVPGGVLILDDYEWGGMYRKQKIAEDAWFEQRQYRVFPLPTGQGMVLKR